MTKMGRKKGVAVSEVEEEVGEEEKVRAVEEMEGSSARCHLCHQPRLPKPLEGGKLYTLGHGEERVTVHYFCMLFTYNSRQVGEEQEGLFGFYLGEVRRQVAAAAGRRCRYCARGGATARCDRKHCGVSMHFPCGQAAGACFQFTGRMTIYCGAHRPRQKVEGLPSPPDTECVICFEEVEQGPAAWLRLRAPCCGRHLHSSCVQSFAFTSGSEHFKCPNCNNKDAILREFMKMGVYFPHKDAEWELPQNSNFYNFQDHYVTTRRDQSRVLRI